MACSSGSLMAKPKMKVRFCWLCGKQLYGNHKELLMVDSHERTFHKACANTVKKGQDFVKRGEAYFSVDWIVLGILED